MYVAKTVPVCSKNGTYPGDRQLKKRVEALKFSANETPEKWSYKMQMLLDMWKRIPADKRGGTIADLSDMLLDKVLEVPSCRDGHGRPAQRHLRHNRAATAQRKQVSVVTRQGWQGANRAAITGGSGYAGQVHDGEYPGSGTASWDGAGHDAHASTGGCQRWSNLAA